MVWVKQVLMVIAINRDAISPDFSEFPDFVFLQQENEIHFPFFR